MFLGEINTGTWPSRLGGVFKFETIKFLQIMVLAELGHEKNCAGEAQQQL
jgi:hypothetical protein